jgi:poly(3-hydroxybutyrate) depolymerase
MRSLAVAVLLASVGYCHAASSKGCGQKLPDGITTDKSNNLTIKTSDGLERSYLLHLPSNYDPKKPHGLIWSYHGRGKNATHQEDITGLSKSASNPDHIVVYPQGMIPVSGKTSKFRTRRQSDDDDDGDDDDDDEEDEDEDESKKGVASWQGDPDSTTDDVKFTLELLEDITKSYCVEEEKVYASGMSNGGGFVANILACDESATKKFAAFAAASGAYYQNDARGKCKPDSVAIQCDNKGAKVPLITTAGGRDKTIPFTGGSRRKHCLPSDPHFLATWAERNGLPSTNETSMVESTNVEHYSFGQGDAAGMVQSYYIPEMGHQWPNGNSKSHISGTKVFMDFFADWNMTRRNSVGKSLPASTYNATAAETGAAALLSVSNYQGLGLTMALLGSMALF